ncbi:MAG: excinuclease ABC subunit UvrC [Patescibacteria group bacterium]|jgi:excinuclease ABC subunit C
MTAISQKLASLPKQPGIYIFRNAKGSVLYVGKAINLKYRVSSYFRRSAALEPSKQHMVKLIADLEYIIVDSETEALFLETTLIKKYHPPYNVIMKDDKNFAYLKIGLAEEFPSVTIVRRLSKGPAKYFGPYSSAYAVRLTLKHMKKIFPVKVCLNKPDDPCFEAQIHRCVGHYLTPTSRTDYQIIIKQFMRFLEGRGEEVVADLEKRMATAASKQQYELASALRDRLWAVNRVLDRQKVILPKRDNLDMIGLVPERNQAGISVIMFRDGKLIDRRNFILSNIKDQSPAQLLATFIEQYYTQSPDHPKKVMLAAMPERSSEIEKLLQLKIQLVQRGQFAKLVKLAEANARDHLLKTITAAETDQAKGRQSLENLAKALRLSDPPHRIETYDISNIQGVNAVGSMIVFENGLAKKSEYRKFKINTFTGSNDPGMLAEVLRRRLKHLPALRQLRQAGRIESAGTTQSVWPIPDLIILDGGRGQLGVVTRELSNELSGIKIVALAKRLEEIFLPGKPNPIVLPPNSEALFLLQRMRDEAHRFAISFYRQTHRKTTVKSQLDEIPGIGPKIKKKLLQKFGSVDGIRRADYVDLSNVIGAKLTESLREQLS